MVSWMIIIPLQPSAFSLNTWVVTIIIWIHRDRQGAENFLDLNRLAIIVCTKIGRRRSNENQGDDGDGISRNSGFGVWSGRQCTGSRKNCEIQNSGMCLRGYFYAGKDYRAANGWRKISRFQCSEPECDDRVWRHEDERRTDQERACKGWISSFGQSRDSQITEFSRGNLDEGEPNA